MLSLSAAGSLDQRDSIGRIPTGFPTVGSNLVVRKVGSDTEIYNDSVEDILSGGGECDTAVAG